MRIFKQILWTAIFVIFLVPSAVGLFSLIFFNNLHSLMDIVGSLCGYSLVLSICLWSSSKMWFAYNNYNTHWSKKYRSFTRTFVIVSIIAEILFFIVHAITEEPVFLVIIIVIAVYLISKSDVIGSGNFTTITNTRNSVDRSKTVVNDDTRNKEYKEYYDSDGNKNRRIDYKDGKEYSTKYFDKNGSCTETKYH